MGLIIVLLIIWGYFAGRSIYRLIKGVGTKSDWVLIVLCTLFLSSGFLVEWLGEVGIAVFGIIFFCFFWYLVWLSIKK